MRYQGAGVFFSPFKNDRTEEKRKARSSESPKWVIFTEDASWAEGNIRCIQEKFRRMGKETICFAFLFLFKSSLCLQLANLKRSNSHQGSAKHEMSCSFPTISLPIILVFFFFTLCLQKAKCEEGICMFTPPQMSLGVFRVFWTSQDAAVKPSQHESQVVLGLSMRTP